jgi:hypothetical protein
MAVSLGRLNGLDGGVKARIVEVEELCALNRQQCATDSLFVRHRGLRWHHGKHA